MTFNWLDCFDDNIDNLDITRNYIYVLKLIDDRYYVGRTTNILNRIEQHFTGYGSKYTNAYKPLKVIEVIEELSEEDERKKTLELMDRYGWEKVRGSYWCSLEIKKPKINNGYKQRRPRLCKENISLDIDDTLRELYINKNKNIIDIGDIINRTPSWVANRLANLKIIDRVQLAKGYFEYYQSDVYKSRLISIINNRKNKKHEICNKNDSDNMKELTNIKERIREKLLKFKFGESI